MCSVVEPNLAFATGMTPAIWLSLEEVSWGQPTNRERIKVAAESLPEEPSAWQQHYRKHMAGAVQIAGVQPWMAGA
jgi:hypothetical protein